MTCLTIAPAPSEASWAARAVMLMVRPWTVMRSPPAAELLTKVSGVPTGRLSLAARSASAWSTPIPTSPWATLVGAKPWPAWANPPSSLRLNPFSLVMVLPTSMVRISMAPAMD